MHRGFSLFEARFLEFGLNLVQSDCESVKHFQAKSECVADVKVLLQRHTWLTVQNINVHVSCKLWHSMHYIRNITSRKSVETIWH